MEFKTNDGIHMVGHQIGRRDPPTHAEQAVHLVVAVQRQHPHAILVQAPGIVTRLVAQWIMGNTQHQCRRRVGQTRRA